ncbi:hypothetical protein NLG97_g2571 [Lecanicillium saksenae]|uniref:Uncharacterized protein n=1 Tax=Lecanicillium saksenae TaxID=468837 RepID=A0ACC1R3U2_9HYPO|nr:hypothetical protein NLG97_g2571 [Lecanicillium saksenae]
MHQLKLLLGLCIGSVLATDQPNESRWQVKSGEPQTVFQFGDLIEIENAVVRNNGKLLITTPSPSAQLWQLDPRAVNGSAKLVTTFDSPSALAVLEIRPDVFAVTTGKVVAGPSGVTGSFSLHVLKISGCGDAQMLNSIPVPDAKFLNKLAYLQPGSDVVLASDSQHARVYAINTASGEVEIILEDEETMGADANVFPVGINGLQRLGAYLYFVNSSKGLLNRVSLLPNGTAAGPYQRVANFSETVKLPDDFAILPSGEAFIAGSNQILHVQLDGSFETIIGDKTSKLIAGATSARIHSSTYNDVLYVTTSGHLSSPATEHYIEPGKVVSFSLDEY